LEVIIEPKRRRDNRCARYPDCKNMLYITAVRQKGVDPKVYDLEPFCSSACCRIWYGTENA
jgi:hypothetical protein